MQGLLQLLYLQVSFTNLCFQCVLASFKQDDGCDHIIHARLLQTPVYICFHQSLLLSIQINSQAANGPILRLTISNPASSSACSHVARFQCHSFCPLPLCVCRNPSSWSFE